MRLGRSIGYACAAILAMSLVWHEHVSPRAAVTPALFHSDPQHISNRLYRVLHVRTRPDGKQYGFDALDPLLWTETNYLLEGKSHQQAIALADEFLRTHAQRQITDPLKRAILQRDLWAVLDWADQPNEPDQTDLPHQPERRELISRLAPIVRSLALSAKNSQRCPTPTPALCSSANFRRPTTPQIPIEHFSRLSFSMRTALGSASALRPQTWQRQPTTCLSPRAPSSWSLPACPAAAMQRSPTSNNSRT